MKIQMIVVVLQDGYDSIRIEMWEELKTFGIRIKKIIILLVKGFMLPWGTQKCHRVPVPFSVAPI